MSERTDMKKKIGYASSHEVVRLSAKRYEQSPYLARYMNDETVFGLYANRFYPLSLGGDAVADYWQLRQGAMLYDVPEKPIEISGPDAADFLDYLFTRKVSKLKKWRARYALACTPQGGILMDGVLIRLAADRFWYVRANGEFESWLWAHSYGYDVVIRDPQSWVLQVQGPKSMAIFQAAIDEQAPEKFGYFHAGQFQMGGQTVIVSRTGWTGEMGFEVYSSPTIDHLALWDHLMACGQPYELATASLESMGMRRIEAGILDNGTDIDVTMTPFEAGLGEFVDFSKMSFIGRAALAQSKRTCLLFGLVCDAGVPSAGFEVLFGGLVVGSVTTGGWSPTLEKGIGYVRFFTGLSGEKDWLGQSIMVRDRDGVLHKGRVVSLPFYDKEKLLPRGLD